MRHFPYLLTLVLALTLVPFQPGISSDNPPASSVAAPEIMLAGLINAAARQGEKRVVLPAGTYRLTDTLTLSDIKNLEIDGTGVRLIMTLPRIAVLLKHCSDVTMRGLTIDYDPLPFTQGTITEISPDKKTLSFDVHAGYPALAADMKSAPRHIFDATTRHWKEGANVFSAPKIEAATGGRSGQAIFEDPQTVVAVGDLIAFDRRLLDHGSSLFVREGGAITLEDIWIQASDSLAFCERYTTDRTVLRRVRIAPGPRPEGATQDRLLSTNADGANFAYCRRGPLLDACDFSFMGDDGMNVHGIFLPVMRVDSPTQLRVARPSATPDGISVILPGDEARFMAPGTFAVMGSAKIASIQQLSSPGDITAAEIGALYPHLPIHNNPSLPYSIYQVTLSEPLPAAAPGQWVDVPAINCPGFVVQNSHFHDHRARGLRIQANDGLVTGNKFERIGSSAIQVGPEIRFWREAGWLDNLRIVNNVFHNVGVGGDLLLPSTYTPGAIAVCGRTDAPATIPYPGNKNVDIENNQIDGCPVSGIYAYAVTGLTVKGNHIANCNTGPTTESGKENGLSVQGPIDVAAAVDPVVEGNTISDEKNPGSPTH